MSPPLTSYAVDASWSPIMTMASGHRMRSKLSVADLTHDEFKTTYLGLNPAARMSRRSSKSFKYGRMADSGHVRKEVDWRRKGLFKKTMWEGLFKKTMPPLDGDRESRDACLHACTV